MIFHRNHGLGCEATEHAAKKRTGQAVAQGGGVHQRLTQTANFSGLPCSRPDSHLLPSGC